MSEYDADLPGRKTMRKREEMIAAEWTMRLAGWLDKCVDGIPDVGSLDPVKPDCVQPARSWRAAVAAKKQEFMSERVKNLPSNPCWWACQKHRSQCCQSGG